MKLVKFRLRKIAKRFKKHFSKSILNGDCIRFLKFDENKFYRVCQLEHCSETDYVFLADDRKLKPCDLFRDIDKLKNNSQLVLYLEIAIYEFNLYIHRELANRDNFNELPLIINSDLRYLVNSLSRKMINPFSTIDSVSIWGNFFEVHQQYNLIVHGDASLYPQVETFKLQPINSCLYILSEKI
jgi:hypothetical protein